MNVKDLASGHFVSDEWNLATFAAWQFYLCAVPVTLWGIYNHTGCGCLDPGQTVLVSCCGSAFKSSTLHIQCDKEADIFTFFKITLKGRIWRYNILWTVINDCCYLG